MQAISSVIKPEQVQKYMQGGRDFIDDEAIWAEIEAGRNPEPQFIRDIIAKALAIETLSPAECAALINVQDEELWQEMFAAAGQVKKKVYDNRLVTFAPLYTSNVCVNNCVYCSFRSDNCEQRRHTLTPDEVQREIEVLAGKIGHKRMILVCGEHPKTGAEYLAETMQQIYSIKVPVRDGVHGQIRRINVNAAPMSIEDLKLLEKSGLGTYQVFHETYHHATYAKLHPAGTFKADYDWRLYCHHRAQEAGIDDVAVGVLFGLYDWRFEVMGMLHHAIDLERQCGIGPHTVSFPRLEPAGNTDDDVHNSPYRVSDADFKKIVTILRLAIPYAGMILTARENEQVRNEVMPLGVTQFDASTRIGIGAYADSDGSQDEQRQQFILGDTRSLDDVVRDLAHKGSIVSFCTAGYRCGRTGEKIMGLLRSGKEGQFCKLNAVLTYREWLDDFASEETRAIGLKLIEQELGEVAEKLPNFYKPLLKSYERIKSGERDLFF